MGCKRLLDIKFNLHYSKHALVPCKRERHNVPVTIRLTGFREAYQKGRLLVYSYLPGAGSEVRRQVCCVPDVPFRADAANRGTVPGGRSAVSAPCPAIAACGCAQDARLLAIHSRRTRCVRAGRAPKFRIRAAWNRVQKDILPTSFAFCNGRHRDPPAPNGGAGGPRASRAALRGTARRGKPAARRPAGRAG